MKKQNKQEIKSIILSNRVIKWAKILKPYDDFSKTKLEYSIDISFTDKEIEELVKLGVPREVHNPKSRKYQDRFKFDEQFNTRFMTIRRNVVLDEITKQPKYPMNVVDNLNKPFLLSEIGNGSKANIEVLIVTTKELASGKLDEPIVSVKLGSNVQIINLEAVNRSGKSPFKPVDGTASLVNVSTSSEVVISPEPKFTNLNSDTIINIDDE